MPAIAKRRREITVASFGVGAVLVALCGCSDTVRCNSQLVAALQVKVTDESGKDVCDISVLAQGPEPDSAAVVLTESDCRFSGGTREGRYSITIVRDDAELGSRSVTVGTDECGPVTEDVVVTVR